MAEGRVPTRRGRHGRGAVAALAATLLLPVMALAAVVQAYALPAEARTQETWYTYKSELGFDFTANVQPGSVYPQPVLRPEQLAKHKLPVDPPQYRRVLVGKLADRLVVSMPYSYSADRPADINARYRIEGTLVTPLWQRNYDVARPEYVSLTGKSVALGRTPFVIPVGELIAEMKTISKELDTTLDLVELRLRPVVEVEARGLQEPVQVTTEEAVTVLIRGGGMAVDVDEPKTARDEKSLVKTRVEPTTVRVLDRAVPVMTLRQISLGAFAVLSLLMAVVTILRLRRRPRPSSAGLESLGDALVCASTFDVGSDVVMVELGSARELMALHLRLERPVIAYRHAYHLIDGSTCYRFSPQGTEG